MVSGKGIAGLMVAATIVMSMFAPIAGLVAGVQGTQSVANEQVTAANDDYVDLDGWDVHEDSETVEFKDGSGSWVTATEGTDYEMAYGNGSVKAVSSGAIDDGDTLRVSYDYRATEGTTAMVIGLVPLFLGLMVLGTFANKI